LIDLTYEDGLVTIIEPQLLDKPRRFSETEAVIITLGLNLLKDTNSKPDQESKINNLLSKLSNKLSAVIDTDLSKRNKPKFYDQIIESIKLNNLLNFRYQALSDDSISLRRVKPTRILYKQGFYYLIAIEISSEDERTFRIDQIIDLDSEQYFPESTLQKIGKPESFKFTLRTKDRYLTEKYQEIFNQITRDGQYFVIEGEVSNQQWLYRWLLSNSPKVEDIGPESLRSFIQDKANNALSLYE
jgi:proteasome accessory factor C